LEESAVTSHLQTAEEEDRSVEVVLFFLETFDGSFSNSTYYICALCFVLEMFYGVVPLVEKEITDD